VAAPVRSAAPVRRHQSLMSGLDHSETVGGLAGRDLRCENFLYCYQVKCHRCVPSTVATASVKATLNAKLGVQTAPFCRGGRPGVETYFPTLPQMIGWK